MQQTVFQKLVEKKLQSIQDCRLPSELDNSLQKVSVLRSFIQEYVSFIVNFIEYYDLRNLENQLDRKFYLSWLNEYLDHTEFNLDKDKITFQGFKGFQYGTLKAVHIASHDDLQGYSLEAKEVAKFLFRELEHQLTISPIKDLNYTPTSQRKIEWYKNDHFLDLSKNKKHFKLEGKNYKFAKNIKNAPLIIEELLHNGQILITKLHKLIPASGGGNERKAYNQFVKTISNSTKHSKEKITLIFCFDEKSKKISVQKPSK